MRAANKKFTRIRRYVSCFGPVLTNVLNMVRSQAKLNAGSHSRIDSHDCQLEAHQMVTLTVTLTFDA